MPVDDAAVQGSLDVGRDSDEANGGAQLQTGPSKRSRAIGKLLAKSLKARGLPLLCTLGQTNVRYALTR